MSTIVPQARLRADLDLLSDLVSGVEFQMASPAQADRRARRDHLLAVARRYLDPRLADPGHPLVVAVFGPTGSGKSTLVNTLAGREISATGVLRPTTNRALAWVHRRHSEVVRRSLGEGVELVEDDHPVLESLVLVDTPDIDSVATDHRRLALGILEAADVALAVTTPQRYADAVPWEVLGELTGRALQVTVVMNRASRRSAGAVIDLTGLLRDAHVAGVESPDDVVVIQEQRIRADGRLHGYALRRLARRLQELAADRAAVARRGVRGAVLHCAAVTEEIASDVESQHAEGARLREVVDDAVEGAREDLGVRLREGDLVRTEVVARWQRLVGLSDLAGGVTKGIDRLRRVFGSDGMDEGALAQVDREIADELVELGVQRITRAVAAVELAWSTSSAGQALLEQVDVGPEQIRDGLADAVAAWRSDLVEVVAETGAGRIRRTRFASYGVNGVATLLLLAVFTSTGGLTGAEVGVAAGAAAAQQALLERLLGTAEIRRLERKVMEGLAGRLGEEVERSFDSHRCAIDEATDEIDIADDLRHAARAVRKSLEDYDDA